MIITSPRPTLRPASSAKEQSASEPHQPSALRDGLEKAGGIVGALLKAPRSMVSGTALGGYHGRRRGLDPEVTTPVKKLALQMYVGNALQSTAIGAVSAFAVSGPGGAALSVAKDVAVNGAKFAVYKKFGKPGSMSRRIARKIDDKVEGGEGAWKGTTRGAVAGGTSAARGGAVMGFRFGRGATSGVIEGASELDEELDAALRPSGGKLEKLGLVAAASLNGLLSVPAGILRGLSSAGVAGGPIGLAIGNAAGKMSGLLGFQTDESFTQSIDSSLVRSTENDRDMGDVETNEQRDLVQGALVGAAAGARAGWNAVIGEGRS